jgi:hypothetical protein
MVIKRYLHERKVNAHVTGEQGGYMFRDADTLIKGHDFRAGIECFIV